MDFTSTMIGPIDMPGAVKICENLFATTVERLQPVVQQSTICPSGLEALQSRTWLRKMTQEIASIYLHIEPNDATSCADFAKPCLASQSF